MNPLLLPWTQADMPHFIVDINRECNITCQACYNRKGFQKPLSRIQKELDQAAAQRRLHTVTIAGGEPTLHPELFGVIRLIRARGWRVVVLTNGVGLDDGKARDLQQAGVDLVLFHIDSGQTRPDLPAGPRAQDLGRLRRDCVERMGRLGVGTGLVATLYPHDAEDLDRLVSFTLESPFAHFLLVTTRWNEAAFRNIHGVLASGFRVAPSDGESVAPAVSSGPGLETVRRVLLARGMRPFGYVGSSADRNDPRWLCYTSAVARSANGTCIHRSISSALSDRLLIRLVRWITGRYLYHVRQNSLRFRAQLLLNALSGGDGLANAVVWAHSFRRGVTLYEKRMVFQSGPTLSPAGDVVHCRNCPDATIVDGHLVPICISDGWVSPNPLPVEPAGVQ